MGGKTYGQARSIASALRRGHNVVCVSQTPAQGASLRRMIEQLLQEQGCGKTLLGNLRMESRCDS